jgi:DNA-binding response OmpR family regulator
MIPAAGNQANSAEKEKTPQIVFYSPHDRTANIVVTGLLHSGYPAIYAGSPYLAIIKTMQFVPSLVIIEICESNSKGFAIVEALRKSVRTKNVALLLLLPSSPADLLDNLKKTYLDRETAAAFEGIPILNYPFSFSELVNRVAFLLKRK